MRLLIFALSLLAWTAQAATSYTEFYCNASTGSNTNAGGTTGAATYSSVNGNWDGTSVFIPTDGSNPVSAGVVTNTFASVYNDGAAVAVYIVRIDAVTNAANGGIVMSTTAKAGTAPTSSATGRSVTVGGVWKGPNGSSGFPFGFATAVLTNAASNTPRVNFKNNAQYNITASMADAVVGPIVWQGYSTNPGDGGRATIDGGTSGTSYVLLAITGANNDFIDLIFQNNGASGSSAGVSLGAIKNNMLRCVVNSVRGHGISATAGSHALVECEAYACNQSNTATVVGINTSGGVIMDRCISHDNVGSNSSGFILATSCYALHCIAESNGAKGFLVNATGNSALINCDAYNNTGDGIDFTASGSTGVFVENCNLIKNGGAGIDSSGGVTTNRLGFIINCAFGAGTQANGTNIIATLQGVQQIGTVTYANDVTPWVDPANGDFRINLAAAEGTGRGAFTQTAASYSGSIAYPDIGAVQRTSVQSGGTTTVQSFPVFQ